MHSIDIIDVKNKKYLQAEANDFYCREHDWREDPSSVHPNILHEIKPDTIFNNREEAYQFLLEYCERKGDYYDGYVKYYDSKPNNSIQKKIDALNDKLEELYKKNYYKEHLNNISSKYITCKHCGSKINREEYIKNNNSDVYRCPVCRNEQTLFSETLNKKMINLYSKRSQIKLQIKKLKKTTNKITKSTPVMYLLKVECHS